MTESEWLATTEPSPMIRFVEGVVSDRKMRLLVCAWCRLRGLLTDDESRTVVEVSERYADGMATEEERLAARMNAYRRMNAPVTTSSASEKMSYSVYTAIAREGRTVLNAVWHLRRVSTTMQNNFEVVVACRDIFGNPFRLITVDPSWLTFTVVALAREMYESRDFSPMPILADALQDAGCDNEDILNHCRQTGEHVRGCWVVDLVLGKE